MKRRFFVFICIFVFTLNALFASSTADKKTALRYLQIANDYLVSSKWNEALSSATMGMAYDDSIADLWYITAIAYSENDLSTPASSIITLLEKALQCEWHEYNINSGKLFLAKYYVQTMEYDKALALLEDSSLILNSDCLKIKAKIAYLTQNKTEARQIIDRAWKIFPKDPDFPLIFFNNEDYTNQDEESELFIRLKDQFLKSVLDYTQFGNRYISELLLKAVCFADEKTQIDLLKIYKTQHDKNPLYPVNALYANYLSEDDAISQFIDLSKQTFDYNQLAKIASLLKTEQAKLILANYLKSFNGKFLFDYNNDSFYELSLEYQYGRPIFAKYEQKQDGITTWESNFDYGTPRQVKIDSSTVTYARFPFISTLENDDGEYFFIPDSVQWVPFEIELSPVLEDSSFFVVLQKNDAQKISDIDLYKNSYRAKLNVTERENAICSVVLDQGIVASSTYSIDNVPYAYGFFENGILTARRIDFDYDGIFEAFINYEVAKENFADKDLADDSAFSSESADLNMSLFGKKDFIPNLFIRQISIDFNNDNKPDYVVIYFDDGNIEKNWDITQNGKSTVQSLETLDGNILSASYNVESFGFLEVYFDGDKPSKYTFNGKTTNLFYDEETNIYWYQGDVVSKNPKVESEIQKFANKDDDLYEMKVFNIDESQYLVVRSFDFVIAIKVR